MELSQSTLRGLQVAGLSSIDDKAFSRLSQLAIQAALGNINPETVKDDPKIAKLDQAVAKESFSALMTVILEAARTDTDATSLSSILEDCKFAPDRIDAFKTLYIENKPQLRANLGRVRSSLPHIVDVDWRLDYYIKSNQMERVDKPVYLIGLKTEKSDEVQTKEIQFACTQEQLQDLVSKLKDASKCLEKFSQ